MPLPWSVMPVELIMMLLLEPENRYMALPLIDAMPVLLSIVLLELVYNIIPASWLDAPLELIILLLELESRRMPLLVMDVPVELMMLLLELMYRLMPMFELELPVELMMLLLELEVK